MTENWPDDKREYIMMSEVKLTSVTIYSCCFDGREPELMTFPWLKKQLLKYLKQLKVLQSSQIALIQLTKLNGFAWGFQFFPNKFCGGCVPFNWFIYIGGHKRDKSSLLERAKHRRYSYTKTIIQGRVTLRRIQEKTQHMYMIHI